MNLQNPYYFFKDIIPHRICDDIIKLCHIKNKQRGTTGDFGNILSKEGKITKKDIQQLIKIRDSNIVWCDEYWIHKEIIEYIKLANINAKWNFEIENSEDMQFTKYEPGQHYDWHQDCWNDVYSDSHPKEMLRGLTRKISAVVSLSNPNDYTGGDFKMFIPESPKRANKKCIKVIQELKSKGSIIVFPSHYFHKVEPILTGTRYSLVSWYLGKPFK
jgi:hypothetical protein